jgi:hypothetical protein
MPVQDDNGVQQGSTWVNSGGIDGFFGQEKKMPTFTATSVGQRAGSILQANQIQNTSAGLNGQQAPTMDAAHAGAATVGPYNTAYGHEIGQIGGQQQALAQALMKQANGGFNTAGQMALRANRDANLDSAMAMASAYRGGSPTAGYRLAAQQRAGIQAGYGAQLAQQQSQDQMAARQALGGVLGQERDQATQIAEAQNNRAFQTALANAGFQQQSNLTNAGFQQQASAGNQAAAASLQQQHNDLIQKYQMGLLSYQEMQRQAQIQQSQFNAALQAQQQATAQGVSSGNAAQGMQIAGSVAQAAGTALAASDERVKTGIEPGESYTREFLNAISDKKYEYKDSKHGSGEYLGFMAQDIEKSRIGKSMVREVNGVKHIDTWKALSAALAGLSNVNKRLNKLGA